MYASAPLQPLGHKETITITKEKVRKANIVYTNQTPYYRQINEPIGESLYRDFQNREKRAQLVDLCQRAK